MIEAVTMLSRVEEFLDHRRRLGFKSKSARTQLVSFARFADSKGYTGALDTVIAIRWAKEDSAIDDPFTWARRLESLRPFAAFLVANEPTTSFPAVNPFGRSKRRLAPHIFTSTEVGSIIKASRQIRRARAAGTVMLPALVGLLAATGLRISEALSLTMQDVSLSSGDIHIRQAKFGRERIVPLHPTAVDAMERFMAKQRNAFRCGRTDPLFKSELTGEVLRYSQVWHAWNETTTRLGLRPRGGHPFVRIHDLRHTFICRRLLQWQAEDADIDGTMMLLSTYVGHLNLRDTYWYLEAIPELMALASHRFDRNGRTDGDVHG